MIKNLDKIIKQVLKEATGTGGGGRGSYVLPVQPGVKLFDKSQLAPFTDEVSKYIDAELEYDSYDGQMSTPKKQIKKMEANAKKISKYKKAHPVQNDDDGDILNNINIKEATSNGGGEYNAPLSFEHIEWEEHTTAPYINHSTHEHNKKGKLGNIRGKVSFKHWFMEKDHPNKGKTKKLITPKEYQDVVNEDLAVWFGTKKKPKGSSQPKGPWVNICRKVEGKHPPCGRSESKPGSYPKCRAAGVAGKMTDSQKKSACQQKRRAEKKEPKVGKGNKPTMVSYKPKKKKTNESNLDNKILMILESFLRK